MYLGCKPLSPMDSSFTQHQIKIMKVALAIAIIRQKPDHCSAKEFTEKLSLQFSQQQIDWKKQAEVLGEELLRLRQQCVQYHMKVCERKGDACTSNTELSSSGYSSLEGSQDMGHVGIDDTTLCIKSLQSLSISKKIENNVKFLQSISTLQHWRQCLSSIVTTCDVIDTIRDSLLSVLNALSVSLQSKDLIEFPVSQTILTSSVECVLDILKMEHMKSTQQSILTACSNLLNVSIQRLCQPSLHKPEDTISLRHIVHHLSSVEQLFSESVEALSAYIEKNVNELKNTALDPLSLELDMIDSLGSVITLLEHIMTKYDHALPEHAVNSLRRTVEATMLSMNFPLVAFAVWRLHGLMIARLCHN